MNINNKIIIEQEEEIEKLEKFIREWKEFIEEWRKFIGEWEEFTGEWEESIYEKFEDFYQDLYYKKIFILYKGYEIEYDLGSQKYSCKSVKIFETSNLYKITSKIDEEIKNKFYEPEL